MEIIKEKIYENGDGGNRQSSTRERANAGMTLGIIGTVLGAAALWGRNGGIGSILGGGSSGSVPENVNINTYGGGSYAGSRGCLSPTPFQAWEKECEDALALTNEMWRLKVGTMQSAASARDADIAEKFGLYKEMTAADFNLYKGNRDGIDAVNNRLTKEMFDMYKYARDKDDETRKELCELKAQVAVNTAVRPYQDKLLQNEIEKAFTAGVNYTDRKTCRMIEGTVVVPSTPTITGFGSYCCCNRGTAAGGGNA